MIEKIQIKHQDVRESLERMPYESVGRLLMAIMAYANDEDYTEIIKDDAHAYVYFPTLQGHIDRMEENRIKAAGNGSKGGAPKGNTNASKNKPKQPKTSENNQKLTPNLTIPNHTNNNKYIVEILSYLNERAGTKFGESKETVRLINARINDGFTVEDFKKVINKKVKEWKGTDRAMYIRPSTLFAPSHFEEYLNAPEGKSGFDAGEHAINPFNRFTQRDIDFSELEKSLIRN